LAYIRPRLRRGDRTCRDRGTASADSYCAKLLIDALILTGLANFRVVGKPEVIDGLRGQVLVSLGNRKSWLQYSIHHEESVQLWTATTSAAEYAHNQSSVYFQPHGLRHSLT
jgi:hypothetical protein